MSQRTRVLEAELRLEATKAGLNDEELAAVSQMIRGAVPATSSLQAGGARALSESEEMQQLEAIAGGVRTWIKLRADLRRRAR